MSRVRDLWHNKDRTRTNKYGKGLRWQAIYTGGPKDQVKSHRTQDGAWAWIFEQDGKKQQNLIPDGGKVLVSGLRSEWFESQVQWSPKNRYENNQTWDNYISPQFGNTILEHLSRRDLRSWVASLSEQWAPSTVDTYFGRFSSFLLWCVGEKRIPASPAEGVELPKAQKRPNLYLTVAEYYALRKKMHEHYRDAVDLAVTTGMRPGELWELRCGDVDVMRRRINIERSSGEVNGKRVIGDTKTEEARSIPITGAMADMLAARVGGRPRTDLVFKTVRSRQVRESNFVSNYWKSAVEKTHLPQNLRFYDLRHTAASWAIRSGASVKAVQRMLGHATALITLEVYAGLFDDELDSVAEKIGEMLDLHRTTTGSRIAA